jgi:hypothetical protein
MSDIEGSLGMKITACAKKHGLRKKGASETFCPVALPLAHPCLRKF